MKHDKRYTVGSFFSGIGGFEIGLEKTGHFRTLWFCEKQAYACSVLRKHWPGVPIIPDITTANWKSIRRPDIYAGGFPCQDISNAGKRAGITGKRSGLWKDYLQAISIHRPKLVIAENVAALLNRGLDTVLCDLASIRYNAEWHCIPASAVGAPHRRDRIFILAYPYSRDKRKNRRTALKAAETLRRQQKSNVLTGRSDPGPDEAVAYAHSQRLQDLQRSEEAARLSRFRTACKAGWWNSEPGMGRVADGIPNRLDRIKCLGNAIVPQVAEFIGQMAIQRLKVL